MDGVDEDYCETLEFNECEDDEYRCLNGMCIPEEYWIDGEYDCMDWTDEIGTLVGSGGGCFNMFSMVCDEHLCPYNQWSCGDGRPFILIRCESATYHFFFIGHCIFNDADRHTGMRHHQFRFCKNMRDANYMCEAITREAKSWWSIDNGYCLPYQLAYQTLGIDSTAISNRCTFSIKCALSYSLDQNCACKSPAECRSMVIESCGNGNLIYPWPNPLLAPYVYMVYLSDRDWTNKKPDRIGYYGQVKCMGYQLITNGGQWGTLDENFEFYRYSTFEYRLCHMMKDIEVIRNYTGPHYDANCWSGFKTFNNHSYQVSSLCETRCISKYRVRDGVDDCFNGEESTPINNSCSRIQQHRFQCSPSEPTCLLVGAVGDWGNQCSNRRDEFDDQTGTIFYQDMVCEKNTDSGCAYLREYIQTSSKNNMTKVPVVNSFVSNDHSISVLPFRSHCNSFFDTKTTFDESRDLCEHWVCLSNEYQCLSGQCIPESWVCDGKYILVAKFTSVIVLFLGEWDCSDGSDEQRLFVEDYLSNHNSKLMNLMTIKQRCLGRYRQDNTPFSNICNLSYEYPCFRTGIDHVFDIKFNRPCINLTQIGDGKIDCLTGLDERNRLSCPNLGMLGFHFQFNDSLCISYLSLCTDSYPWKEGANVAYDTACFYHRNTFRNSTESNCYGWRDVMCFNDTCIKQARCNGRVECPHGEDEYRCVSSNQSPSQYRNTKDAQFTPLQLPIYSSSGHLLQNSGPLFGDQSERTKLTQVTSNSQSAHHLTRVLGRDNSELKTVYETVRDAVGNREITFEKDYLPFICNRGLAVKYYTGHTVCFCPPSFYGLQCEYYSDRITVATHLQLNNSHSFLNQINVIKVLTTFLFKDEIIDYYEFYVDPQTKTNNNYVKQQIYFLYPRLEKFLQLKQTNRSSTQLYNVRFEAFKLHSNETIEIVGVWIYAIYFDNLPSFRLSKSLRFQSPVSSITNNPCLNQTCSQNGMCQKIINVNDLSYFCSCKSGYYGIHCEHYDEKCNHFCSPQSVCKPKYRGILTDNQQHPLCLCPLLRFGKRCYLRNDYCSKNPCLNGGSCIIRYELTDRNENICICTDSFQGDHCQFPKGMVNITFMFSSDTVLQADDVVAATVFYSNYQIPSLRFIIRHQQVYTGLPLHLKLFYSDKVAMYAPTTAVLKVYGLNYYLEEAKYYLLYFDPGRTELNITIDLTLENHCPLVETLWHLVKKTDKLGNLKCFIF